MIENQAFKIVEQEYIKLQECINDLANTIHGTISEQKEDMLLTHKSQLRKLSIEMEQLKLEKTKLEDSISTNERANLLENERDWFKKEALHLDNVLEKTKVENKELKAKLDESEVDRKWMKEQIEKLTKNNWALEKQFKELGIGGVHATKNEANSKDFVTETEQEIKI